MKKSAMYCTYSLFFFVTAVNFMLFVIMEICQTNDAVSVLNRLTMIAGRYLIMKTRWLHNQWTGTNTELCFS